MGWADCGYDEDGRPIGYAIEAECDEPGCEVRIDRGLFYCCGSMHGGGRYGCGRYFCSKHLFLGTGAGEQLCRACADAYEAEHPEDDG